MFIILFIIITIIIIIIIMISIIDIITIIIIVIIIIISIIIIIVFITNISITISYIFYLSREPSIARCLKYVVQTSFLILAHRLSAQWLPHRIQPFIGSSLAESPFTHSRKSGHTQRQQRTRGEKQHIRGDKPNFASWARLTPQTRGSSSHQAEPGPPSVHQRNIHQKISLTLELGSKSHLPRINKTLLASPG